VYFVPTKTLKYWIASITVSSSQSLPVSLRVSKTCSSLSPSAPEAVSAALACSVYTVQPSDCCHAHSLLCLCSKVICILSSFIPRTFMSRVPESYQSYPMSPPMTPAAHSAISYCPNTHILTRHPFQRITAITIHLLLLPPVHCRLCLCLCAVHHRLLLPLILYPGSGIDQNSSEVFGGHSYSFKKSLGIVWIHFSC
jgi:hypothetical protein